MTDAADKTALLSEHTRHEIDHWVAKFPVGRQRSAVMPLLKIHISVTAAVSACPKPLMTCKRTNRSCWKAALMSFPASTGKKAATWAKN